MASFEEKLINFVRAHDFLYNTKLRDYKSVIKRDLAWTQIAEKLDKSVEDCRQRWKSLRDRYVREMKKMESPSANNTNEAEIWPLYSDLEFLRDSVKLRRKARRLEPLPLLDDSSGSQQHMHSPNPGINFSFLEMPTESSMTSSCSKKPRIDELEIAVNEGTIPYQSHSTPQRPNETESQVTSQRSNPTGLQENDYFMQMINKKMKSLPYRRQIHLQEEILSLVNQEIVLHVESSNLY